MSIEFKSQFLPRHLLASAAAM